MRKYTERLDIKMTAEDMALLAESAIRVGVPLTVHARNLILLHINPLLGGNNASSTMESGEPGPMED